MKKTKEQINRKLEVIKGACNNDTCKDIISEIFPYQTGHDEYYQLIYDVAQQSDNMARQVSKWLTDSPDKKRMLSAAKISAYNDIDVEHYERFKAAGSMHVFYEALDKDIVKEKVNGLFPFPEVYSSKAYQRMLSFFLALVKYKYILYLIEESESDTEREFYQSINDIIRHNDKHNLIEVLNEILESKGFIKDGIWIIENKEISIKDVCTAFYNARFFKEDTNYKAALRLFYRMYDFDYKTITSTNRWSRIKTGRYYNDISLYLNTEKDPRLEDHRKKYPPID